MKKVLLLSSFLALGAVASYGAVATCTSLLTLDAVTTAGTCEVGDKLFSNFVYSPGASDPTAAQVSVQGTQSIAGAAFGLQFGSNIATAWVSGFTLSYDISIDTTACATLYGVGANCFISGLQDQLNGVTAGPSNTAALTIVHTAGGTVNVNALSTANETGQITGLNQTTMHNAFTATGETGTFPILQFSSEVFQTTVPEPISMSLTGLGLLGLGFFGRRRLKS